MREYRLVMDTNSEDFDRAMVIYRSSFPENERLPEKKLAEKITNQEFQLLVSYEESKVSFMAILCPLKETNFSLLGYVAVAENLRGKGIGEDFLKYLGKELKEKDEFLLLEVENPASGDNQATKQRRLNFYQRLGAKILDKVRFLLPNLWNETPPEMLLMIYPFYPLNYIKRELVEKLINKVYEDFYEQYQHPNIELLCKNIPDIVNLI
ncbi:GNAT family N-acetyltransferase [Geminocystis sp. CENA526]|uniref:GNAT family N-acetyltransferase n=1 Tax=Geminocystis sp. CENA526 TaxID=1355871 RepID=UPI003D6EF1A5